jgi:Secretion system C-terminal sorting domain
MRFCYFFVFVIFISLTVNLYSQIPNNGFEQWSGGNPVSWSSTNDLGVIAITQSSDAHGGSSAVRGDAVDYLGNIVSPILISGLVGGHGFPISERYANLTGYYKLNVVTDENLSVVVGIYKNGQVIGVGGSQFFNSSAYALFTVPIYYTNGQSPDSCQITLAIGNNSGAVNLGSYFIVDDLAFEGISVDVNETDNTIPNEFSLEQNYPNPFNPSTKIRYSIPSTSSGETQKVTLKVYNMLGNEVATLVNEEQTAGNYKISFNPSGLSSGIYLYKLQSGNFVQTKKMIYLK